MTQLRCTLFALLGLSLAACTEDDTIVSVNYSLGEGVAIEANNDTQIHVLITQGGQKFEATFPTPVVPGTKAETLPDGGDGTGKVDISLPDAAFFQRYELSGFGGGEANLKAELLDGTTVLFTSESVFDVREHGAVAAYVDFVVDPPEPDETGSSAETAPSSSAPTDAGSDSGAAPTSAPDAISSTDTTSSSDAAVTASDSGTAEAGTTASDAATTGSSDAAPSGSDASTGG